MLSKIAKLLTRNYKLIVIIATLLLIPSAIGALKTGVNYDILSYLPQDLDSTQGEKVLENTFHDAATSMLVIDNMPSKDVSTLKEKIKQVEGVNDAVWVDDIADISVPQEMLPQVLKSAFYSDKSTLMLVTYDGSSSSTETLTALGNVKTLLNKQCFLSGFSAIIKDTKDLSDQEMPIYVALAMLLSLAAMMLCLESWVLPIVFILGIFFAVVYNFGTNIFLGQISYVTKAIAAILQLGVTMDYSIFLINRYDEEKPKFEDRRDAMAQAIQNTFLSLSGSSLTTVAGFFALCFMRLALGKDIGIVMMKGVIIGVITTVTVLPALILQFDKPIHKYTHRNLIPSFALGTNFLIRHRRVIVTAALLLIIPATWSQAHTQVYYNLDRSLPKTLDSIVATDKLKTQFNMLSTHFLIVDDKMPSYQMENMVDEIKKQDGVKDVLAYDDIIGPAVPDDFIPQSIKDICKKDGRQLVMINSTYQAAEDRENQQIAGISAIAKKYDPTSQMTGEGALTKDLIEIANVDFKVTNYISILCILLIVGVVFKSFSIPFLLTAIIELAIFINLGIPYFTGTVIPFISPTVIGCVQLGATVDYSILMTTRFQEELKAGHDRLEAIKIASNTSFKSIITSALVFFCATSGVAMISKIEIIGSICSMLARGAIISGLIIILILPAVLYMTEPFISKTSFSWKNNQKAA
ncbi:efflux RND transporter permease subunit [Caproiciproducens faecalis]|uniref:MMPL family transporter n=1 Tax=Caproiciproducens faecalis TaxID=2820301 RepID=A0ABS7DQJ4_9FIRM|nr:MMPL family transporter [Caproiciproducens faecalis]MBW7572851.1 MMPL family transporter [Caproiciproducens faecalis]